MKTPSLVLLILGFAIATAHAQVSQEWVERYASPTPYNDVPYAMTVDAAGHIYVTGTAATTGANDWTTIKYDTPYAIAVHSSGDVYVSGSSGGTGTSLDYATIKYAQAAASVPSGPDDSRGVFALRSDPNPFARATRVSFTIPAGTDRGTVRLAVYDVNGKEVAILVNEDLAPGIYERELHGGTLPAGIYWSRLQAGGASEEQKLIRVR